HMFLKISLMKGVMHFGKKGKLIPRYIGPFKVFNKVGNISYQLAFPSNLSHVHPVFHVFILQRYVSDPSHILQPQVIKLDEHLTYEEILVTIIDEQVRRLRNKEIDMVKELWKNYNVEEIIWETKEHMMFKYPYLFSTYGK